MKAKIDLEKFVRSLMERYYEKIHIDPTTTKCWLDSVLEDQGLEYKDGKIVKMPQESEQKSIDNIKQKFHVGDWITFYGSKPFKILKVESEQNGILDYLLLEPSGHATYYNKKYVDENARLWT